MITMPVTAVDQAGGTASRASPFWISAMISAPEDGAQHRPRAAAERGAADDRRGDDSQLRADADRRAAVAVEGEGDDGGDTDDEPHQGHDQDPRARDPDTGEERGLAVAADRLHAPAEGRAG